MDINNILEKCNFKILSGNDNLNRIVKTVFCCDLLSLAISRAPNDSCWLTVMGNLNTVAVATLTDISCIVLCEGVTMDNDGLKKAQEEKIPVLCTNMPIYETALKISEIIGK